MNVNQVGYAQLSYHNLLLNNKILMPGQLNNMDPCPKFSGLERLCLVELLLISQIIPFMFIVAETKGAQDGLEGQGILL